MHILRMVNSFAEFYWIMYRLSIVLASQNSYDGKRYQSKVNAHVYGINKIAQTVSF